MHYIKRKHLIRSLRLSGFFSILVFLSLALLVPAFGFVIVSEASSQSLILLGSAIGLILILQIIHSIIAQSARCQLCKAPVTAKLHCSRSPKARKLLGSYRLRVSLGIVFRGRFSCTYCGESFQFSRTQKSAAIDANEAPGQKNLRSSGRRANIPPIKTTKR